MTLYGVYNVLFPEPYLDYWPTECQHLSQEEVNDYREVFMLFDRTGAELITNDELGIVMRAVGQIPTEAEMFAIISEIDADGNGFIEYPEFVDLMTRRPPGRQGSPAELREAFRSTMDRENTGRVALDHFRYMMSRFAECLTDEELNELMKLMKPDGDGKVNYDIIVRMLTKRPKRYKKLLS